MKSRFENGILTFFPEGRLNAYTAGSAEKEMLQAIGEHCPEKVCCDCGALEYIASAGLRVLLRIGKQKPLSLCNVSYGVYEVLHLTGFDDLFETRRQMRTLSVEGCKVVGKGFSSTVYRYDPETIVKVFSERISLERIYSETESAKKSFVSGIPTAIPYDVVRVGNGYGTMFEFLDADTLSQNLMDHPERFDELMDKYVRLLRQFHETPAVEGAFPDIRKKYHTWAGGLGKYMEEDEVAALHRLIDAIPERKTMLHVDCHSQNIMVQDGKLIFVDMADVSEGHPLVDIGTEYFHYIIARETSLGAKLVFRVEPEDHELPVKVWNALVDRYFAGKSEEQMCEIREMLRYFGCMRCLILVAKHSQIDYGTAMELVNRQRADLYPHIDRAAELFAKADQFFPS